MSGRRFQIAADGVYLNHLLFLIIKAVNLYLIHSVIHTEDVFIVRHPAGACHVRAEITLCHASVSFIIYTVHDPPYGAVFVQAQDRGLSVMITGYEDKLVLQIAAQMTAPHSADGRAV